MENEAINFHYHSYAVSMDQYYQSSTMMSEMKMELKGEGIKRGLSPRPKKKNTMSTTNKPNGKR